MDKERNKINYGIDLEREKREQDGTEYLAGILPVCKAKGFDELSFEEAKRYFPEGEVQRGVEDMMDCATRDKNNYLEAKLNYLVENRLFSDKQIDFLMVNGYFNNKGKVELSDAFTAILSGTTKQGNSLKAPAQAIHEYGCVPKALLPLEEWMTWDDYHNLQRVTQDLKDIGQKFKQIIGEIFYGKEYEHGKLNMTTAVFAWPSHDSNGVYQRVEYSFNHAVFEPKSDELEKNKWAYDNYRDFFDGDFLKKLAPNYKFFDYGYAMVIGNPKDPNNVKLDSNWLIDLLKRLKLWPR